MTNIEKIKQARQDLDAVIEGITEVLSPLGRERLLISINRLSYLQAEALRQATEVADENFARAQKLSEQVQENVRHIERLAGERGEVFTAAIEALEIIAPMHDYEKSTGELAMRMYEASSIARRALALAKGEAV